MVDGMDDPVPGSQVPDLRTDLLDGPDTLVAEDRALLHAREGTPDHVQVRAADRARCQPHYGVRGLLDGWFGYVVEPDVADAVKDYGLH